jgi:carbon storage regulator
MESTMLVLTRMKEQVVRIGDDIEVKILDYRYGKIRLGITCPPHVPVHRQEVYERLQNGEPPKVR